VHFIILWGYLQRPMFSYRVLIAIDALHQLQSCIRMHGRDCLQLAQLFKCGSGTTSTHRYPSVHYFHKLDFQQRWRSFKKAKISKNTSSESRAKANTGHIDKLKPLAKDSYLWHPQVQISIRHVQQNGQDFLPVKIWVNGEGILQQLRERVFNVFFTTKSA